jgi:hypothetical protein
MNKSYTDDGIWWQDKCTRVRFVGEPLTTSHSTESIAVNVVPTTTTATNKTTTTTATNIKTTTTPPTLLPLIVTTTKSARLRDAEDANQQLVAHARMLAASQLLLLAKEDASAKREASLRLSLSKARDTADAAEAAQRRAESSRQCAVCMIRVATVASLPCGHVRLCEPCK